MKRYLSTGGAKFRTQSSKARPSALRNIRPQGYRCQPTDWELCLFFVGMFSTLVFSATDITAILLKFIRREQVRKSPGTFVEKVQEHSRNPATEEIKSNSLQGWFSKISRKTDCSFHYTTKGDAYESVFVSATFSAFAKRCARILLRERDHSRTSRKIINTVREVRLKAEQSIKFRFMFKVFLCFLQELETASMTHLSEFLYRLANYFRNEKYSWYLQFVHMYLRDQNQPKNEYETCLAILSLFYEQGAGLECYAMMGHWKTPCDAHDAGMTLLMYFAVLTCTADCKDEINVTEDGGLERILLSNREKDFHRYVSLTSTKSDSLFKDKMMYDISLNCCNEYVESSWSDEKMERAIWTLQYGMKHISAASFSKLKNLVGQHKIDLTAYKPIHLLSFSVSGLIFFQGRHECAYKITGDQNASIVVRGTLPPPTLRDFQELGLLCVMKKSRFLFKHLPGLENRVRVRKVADRLHMMETSEAEVFEALLDQTIA